MLPSVVNAFFTVSWPHAVVKNEPASPNYSWGSSYSMGARPNEELNSSVFLSSSLSDKTCRHTNRLLFAFLRAPNSGLHFTRHRETAQVRQTRNLIRRAGAKKCCSAVRRPANGTAYVIGLHDTIRYDNSAVLWMYRGLTLPEAQEMGWPTALTRCADIISCPKVEIPLHNR